ncbi:MAG: TetR/AcrR family transcriptional regulator [Candidatus Dormibacteria bacterium]
MSLAALPERRTATRKSERTRKRIIAAARQIFEKRGYRDTTIDHITRRARVAHGTFYLYFRGKGELLSELLAQAMGEFDALASRPPVGEAEIADLVRESLRTYERNRLSMRLLREASASDPDFRQHYDVMFVGRLVEHLTASIVAIQQSPAVSGVPVDPRAAARAIVGLIESFAYGIYIGAEDYTEEVVVSTLTHVCSRTIGLST